MESNELGGYKPMKAIDSELVLPTTAPVAPDCNCVKAPCNCGGNTIKTTVSQAVTGVKELSSKLVADAKKERVQKVLLLLGAGLLVYEIVKK